MEAIPKTHFKNFFLYKSLKQEYQNKQNNLSDFSQQQPTIYGQYILLWSFLIFCLWRIKTQTTKFQKQAASQRQPYWSNGMPLLSWPAPLPTASGVPLLQLRAWLWSSRIPRHPRDSQNTHVTEGNSCCCLSARDAMIIKLLNTTTLCKQLNPQLRQESAGGSLW